MTSRGGLPDAGYIVVPKWMAPIVIGMVVSMLTGMFYIGWYMSSLDGRVATLETDAARSQDAAARLSDDRDRLTVVEQQVISIRQAQKVQNRTLERIGDRLEQFYRNGHPPTP
jgi:MFS superfamily sulfate permease-like transporter